MLSEDDKSCWVGSNVVGGKMSGVVVVVFRLAVLLPESTGGTDDDAAVAVAAEGV